ncbi:tyrosine-type recombinase/integrase [Xanthobacter variabilis]|uniref:tyrosine-type recombinase/integrase n=1 Tax=Xanthobacter variabilis TaxID=3119932 RepID=UPI003727B319
MPKLTKRIVDATPAAPDRKVMVWDGELKGFGLRVTPAGAKSYVVAYRTPQGRSREFTIGKHGSPWTCDEARNRAREVLHDIARGIDPLETKASARAEMTVAELVELYLAEGPAEKPNKKASSWATDRSNLTRHAVPLMGRRLLKSVSASDVAKVQADVAAGKTSADVKTGFRGRARVRGGRGIASRVVASLGGAFTFALSRGLVDRSPVAGVRLLKGEKKERFLSEAEVAALADSLRVLEETRQLHERFAAAIRLLLLTGCRKGEVVGLQWSWIDMQRGVIRLPDSKTGAKVVPLAPAAAEVLAGLGRVKGNPFVLPAIRGDQAQPLVGLQKAWEKVRAHATEMARERARKAGTSEDEAPNLSDVRIHDLRHSFASFAVMDGASLFLVGKVLGHKQARTTEVYAHLRDDPLQAVAARTAARIAEAMKGPQATTEDGTQPVNDGNVGDKEGVSLQKH